MFLHIMPASRYTIDFIDKINKVYNSHDHYFIIYGCDSPEDYHVKYGVVVKKIDKKIMRDLWRLSYKAKRVYLQSLYVDTKTLTIVTALSLLIPGRFSWYVWSADLIKEHEMELQIRGLMLKRRLIRFCRKTIIKRLHQIIVTAPSDYEYAFRAYKTEAEGVVAYYAYKLPDEKIVDEALRSSSAKVMVGHSASPRGNHKDIYKYIHEKKYSGDVISILSYGGDDDYVKSVVEMGRDLFGDNYYPITDWMSYKDYIHLLTSLNAAIIPANRQNGAGNIMYLLYLGKKVFLHKKNGTLDYLRERGVTIYELDDITDENLRTRLSDNGIKKNREVISCLCSDENFKKEWNFVFGIKENG